MPWEYEPPENVGRTPFGVTGTGDPHKTLCTENQTWTDWSDYAGFPKWQDEILAGGPLLSGDRELGYFGAPGRHPAPEHKVSDEMLDITEMYANPGKPTTRVDRDEY